MKQILDDVKINEQKAKLYISCGAYKGFSAGRDQSRWVCFGNLERKTMLNVYYLGYSILRTSFFQRRICQRQTSFEIIQKGQMYFRVNGETFLAEKNECVILHARQNNDLFYEKTEPCYKFGLILEGEMLDDILEYLQLNMQTVVYLKEPARLIRILLEMKRTLNDPILLSGKIVEFLQLLARDSQTQNIPSNIAMIVDFIHKNLNKQLSVSSLAESYGASIPIFTRVFRHYFSLSPYQYIKRQRMLYAASLLSRGQLRVKEVADLVGYLNAKYFSTEFLAYHGMSPREYQQKFQKN